MKSRYLAAAATIAACMAMPVAAHHMAEGIVNDDIYTMIDENLAGTPHLDIELDVVSMEVMTVTVPVEDVDDVLQAIADVTNGMGDAVDEDDSRLSSAVTVDISLPDTDGLVTITITENLGTGQSWSPSDQTP